MDKKFFHIVLGYGTQRVVPLCYYEKNGDYEKRMNGRREIKSDEFIVPIAFKKEETAQKALFLIKIIHIVLQKDPDIYDRLLQCLESTTVDLDIEDFKQYIFTDEK